MAPNELADATAEKIEAALRGADLNALRLALYQITGDEELLRLATQKASIWGEAWRYTILSPDAEDVVRDKARAYLAGSRGANDVTAHPSDSEIRRMIKAFTGDDVSDLVLRWSKEELAFDTSLRNVEWRARPSQETLDAFNVLIVGAGMAGLATGMQLARLGVPYTIVERNAGIGGTWWVNTYPDARVDLPSHHYEFSFEKNYPWEHHYAVQPELKKYLEYCAEKYGVSEHIQLSTEIVAATWDDAAGMWSVDLKDVLSGAIRTVRANVIVSAIGVFHTPNDLNIAGAENFGGKIFHTTQWDHSYDVRGKRVALVGTGSTGVQLMPWLSQNAGHLTVFQRTATWMMEVPGYRDAVPEESQWLFEQVPHYLDWHRYGMFYTNLDDTGGLQEYDREWQKAGGKISARHDRMSKAWTDYVHARLGDNPELLRKSLPDHIPWAKRPVVESGWYDALRRPNVELITDGIDHITPTGIVTADGKSHDVDLIVVASGFQTQKYLWPVKYTGRDGLPLEKFWEADGARAHLGLTVPHFPNLFILYGPNGQPRTVSNFTWSELWARFSALAIREMLEGGHKTMEVREDVFDRYNCDMDSALENLIWNDPGQENYYVNKFGRIGHNMPWRADEYYQMIEGIERSNYLFDRQ